jgi:acyl-CoA synthetase (AMP-forming)/AMP-acid ligase II
VKPVRRLPVSSSAPAAARVPAVAFGDRLWPADEMTALAASRAVGARELLPPGATLTALPLANTPEAIALLFALSSLALPVIVYPPDPRAWRSAPPVPAGTPLFLPPGLGDLAPAAEAEGLRPFVLPSAKVGSASGEAVPFLACPGFVNFTSGSTGRPKPVYITTASFLRQTAAIVQVAALSARSAVACSLPLSTHYGFGQALFVASLLGSTLGVLERFEPRALLALFAARPYAYWAGTPLMVELLTRAPAPPAPVVVPPVCHISTGKVSPRVFRAFADRFGVRLRPNYGQTENGFITVDVAPPEQIRPECVGQAAPGIEVRIGDDPLDPYPPGRLGRVWFSSPWYMEGYGFPPDLAPRAGRAGWWPTADMGVLDETGYLTLAGRVDDCFKTATGYLVSPGEIAQALASHPAVVDVVVLPVAAGHGAVVGAMVERSAPVEARDLREAAARLLPPWLQPQLIVVTDRLPRLPGGKADRQACLARLREASAG